MSFRHVKSVILVTLLLLLAVHAQGLEPGRIVVHSTPSGAVVCIDAVYCDTTDAIFTVTGNTWHSVIVTNKGYVEWSDTVFVSSNQNRVVNAEMELNPSATVIQVDITPGGGTICLDTSQCHANVGAGSSSGSTQFTGASEGYHTITVESPSGYLDYYTPVYVYLAKTTYVTINLKPLISTVTHITPVVTPTRGTGVVRVYVDQTGSTICLDNTDCRINVGGTAAGSGTTLFTNVTANYAHSISVTADGYRPYATQVTVSKDLVTTVDVSLQPLAVDTTTTTTGTPVEPTLLPSRAAGLDALPVLGALVLCGAIFLFRKNGR
ncbi:PEGA domain-containing protein [Methanoregula sp.]|uniref:PEGA domain-containing protein n=1 Tax=Methanoregula sp. TaxID=2052170 RepID=UPI002371AAB0|nr:PEGA domain-containing protein [Methanoregula sp.]MDD1686384.1 PEGA domain-containing protein [Methanoregula sp.]